MIRAPVAAGKNIKSVMGHDFDVSPSSVDMSFALPQDITPLMRRLHHPFFVIGLLACFLFVSGALSGQTV